MNTKDLRTEREQRRRLEYKNFILKAAEDVIVRKGYNAMTMDDVAREAQFSKATLYHYFKGKGELILEIIADYFEQMNQELIKIKATKKSATEKLRRGIHYYLKFHEEKMNISRVLLMDKSFMTKMRIFVSGREKQMSKKDKNFLNMTKARRKEIVDKVSSILAEGTRTKEFRKMDMEAAVEFLESALQGYCHGKFWQEKKQSVNKETEFILGFFLHGIEHKQKSRKGETR
jgi:AcrR family transcriptional regulator